MGVKIFIKKPLKLADVQNCKEYLSSNNNHENSIKPDENYYKKNSITIKNNLNLQETNNKTNKLNSTNNEKIVGFENNNFKDKYLD